jgi:hypothetical protein
MQQQNKCSHSIELMFFYNSPFSVSDYNFVASIHIPQGHVYVQTFRISYQSLIMAMYTFKHSESVTNH